MKGYKLFIFIVVALLPVLILRDYTPDNELRYLSIVDEAMENGTFFTFYNQGEIYADKPPLYFWLIMLGKYLLGGHYMWFLSLFSLIPAFVITKVMDKWIAGDVNETSRLTGMWMMMSCGLFTGMAVVLRMDMLMCMFITLSLYTFYKMVRREGNLRKLSYLFPVYIFLAVFSKGPVGILIPLVATIVFLLITGRIRDIGRYWGWETWGILLTGCILWFGAVYWEGGNAYLNNLLFHQTIDRAVNSFHHEEPFYYYFISIWYSLLPWSLLLIGGIITALWKKMHRTELQTIFLTIIMVTFVMLSLISSKIAVYMLPAFPFFVYLPVTYLPHFRWNRWLALSIAVPALVFCCALPAFIVIAQMEETQYLGTALFYAAAGILTLTGCIAFFFLYKRKETENAIRSISSGLFCAVCLGGWTLPSINGEIGYRELCTQSMEFAQKHNLTEYHVWKIRRPESMDVYLKQSIQITTPEELAASGKHGIAFMVPSKRLKELPPFFMDMEKQTIGKYTVFAIK